MAKIKKTAPNAADSKAVSKLGGEKTAKPVAPEAAPLGVTANAPSPLKVPSPAKKSTPAQKQAPTPEPAAAGKAGGIAKAATAKRKPAAKTKAATSANGISLDDIALRAYFIAEKRRTEGRHGDEHQDWIEAERQLVAESSKGKRSRK